MSNQSSAKLAMQQDVEELGEEFAEAVVTGLSKPRKSLPSRYFYDAKGSELFEEITRLPEYYPTRAEIEILRANAESIAASISPDTVMLEFGSGSSLKTEILLDHMPGLRAYLPIDVSESALEDARARLASRYPDLDIRPLVGDFSKPIDVPADLAGCARFGFFPGSTIGNLVPTEAAELLRTMGKTLAKESRLVIGIDLKKDVRTLINAYNDAAGVTAAFNLNLLDRINRELGASIDADTFRHEAIYNPKDGRIEMHLISNVDQVVEIRNHDFRFRAGETIHTENSYKYGIEQFQDLARQAGWEPHNVWTDSRELFSVHELGLT